MSDTRKPQETPGSRPGQRPGGGFGPGMHGGRMIEKAKDFKGTFRKLLTYLKPYRAKFIIVMIFALAGTVFSIFGPKLTGQITTTLAAGLMPAQPPAAPEKAPPEADQPAPRADRSAALKAMSPAQRQALFASLSPEEKKAMLTAMSPQEREGLFNALSPEQRKAVFQALSPEQKMGMIAALSPAERQTMFKALTPGEKNAMFMGIPEAQRQAVFKALPPAEQEAIIQALSADDPGAMQSLLPKPNIDFDAIGRIVLILIGLYFLSNIFSFIQQYLMAGVSQKIVFNLRREVNEKLTRLPLKFFDSRTHGEIMSRVTNDLDTVGASLQQIMTQLITSVFMILGFLVMMIVTSPILTLITLVTLPVSIIVTARITKVSQKNFAAQQKELGRLNGHVEEMYTGHQIVKAFGHEGKSLAEFNDVNGRLATAAWKAQFVSGIIMPLMMFVSNLGYVAICVAGGIMAGARMLALGDIQAFIAYMRQFNMPITQVANITNIFQSTMAAAERVFELLAEPEEIKDRPNALALTAPRGDVSFQNVTFGYKEGVPLMEGLSLDVKEGQTIAIVGPTGAGKTTLVNLLMRFYEIGGGKITVDGADIRDMKRADLRRLFGMVLQDTWLFNGTIRENIAYGREGASDEDIIAAAKAAHADHFIRALPEGYQTVLTEEAANISQGEKQLLTIARAILADPAVLILDEATSNVDTRTEVAIQKAMQALMQGRTSFVIAHRLSTIRDAETILVMNNGRIIETGNHKTLLAQGGFYAELYNSQFSGAFLQDENGQKPA